MNAAAGLVGGVSLALLAWVVPVHARTIHIVALGNDKRRGIGRHGTIRNVRAIVSRLRARRSPPAWWRR